MKLNKIHNDLSLLYKNYDTKQLDSILGFEFQREDFIQKSIRMFNNGYWSVMPVGFQTYDNFAVCLTPNVPLKASKIVRGDDSNYITFSNNLSTLLVFEQLQVLKNPDFIKYINEDWALLERLSLPFRKYTNNIDCLEFLKEYLQNEDTVKKLQNRENYEKVYLEFWNYYYNSQQQENYSNDMLAMLKEDKYIPEDKDYGIWKTRMHNAMAQKSYRLNLPFEKAEDIYWNSFIEPHSFDAVDYIFDILPSSSALMHLNIRPIADQLESDPYLGQKISDKIENHPLFKVLEIIRDNRTSYNGDAHIEAAKAIDEQLGDPVMAWNALVSAGYWSGANYNEPNMAAWNAAIALSEKHGWSEINEALKDQLAFYDHYKNNL